VSLETLRKEAYIGTRTSATYHARVLLAGDIGGTKSLFAWVGPDGEVERERKFASADHESVAAMVSEFLAWDRPKRISLAVAGPVRGATARITNLGWTVDANCWPDAETRLINDGAAIAASIPVLGADDVVELYAGDPDPAGPIALVAPGTGLGMAVLTANGPLASEGGHAAFAPGDNTELLAWLKERVGRVTREHACSGRTLPDLYEFILDGGWVAEDPRVHAAPDRTRAIVESNSRACVRTVRLFLELLADIAGDWGLEVAASGGIYLAGGMAVALLDRMREPFFLSTLQDKGRYAGFVGRMPVRVILDSRAALRGAIALAD